MHGWFWERSGFCRDGQRKRLMCSSDWRIRRGSRMLRWRRFWMRRINGRRENKNGNRKRSGSGSGEIGSLDLGLGTWIWTKTKTRTRTKIKTRTKTD